ncbi:MAG: proton glutamate symport protein [Pseudoalteromonas tetraodonis]|jgi:proton glutamate symport protein
MIRIKPWLQILIALILAVIVGCIINKACAVERVPVTVLNDTGQGFVGFFDYIGKLFLQALKMVIVPLIFSSIVVGIAGLGKSDGFGRLGMKTLGYYTLTSFFAIIIGLSMVNLFKPGLEDGKPNEKIVEVVKANEQKLAESTKAKAAGQDTEGLSAVGDIFKRMIPDNVFSVFADNGRMLALIFVSLLVAFGLIYVSVDARDALLGFFRGLNELMILITNWVMLFAPIGVFGLVASAVAMVGPEIFLMLAKYFFVVIGALLIHALVILPILLKVLGKVSPLKHFGAMRNALLTAFSTASSSATLPLTLRAVQENAGVSKRVGSFVLPLGATVNMDGTALYECVAVIFVAQIMGIEMTLTAQFMVVALALLTSIGVAGIPSASLVAILVIMNNVNIANGEAFIGLLLAVDRLLDMTRTAVNIFSDSCGAVIIAKSEGEDLLV